MNPTINHLITRKHVAEMIGVSAEQVRRNEKRWGIDRARRDLNRRCVRYNATMVRYIFKSKGWIE